MKLPHMPRGLFPLLVVTFISTFGFSVILPFLVVIATKYGASPIVYGLLGATYPAFQIIGSPILGALSDRVGRKPALVISQAGTLLSWILFAVVFFLPIIKIGTYEIRGGGIITVQLIALFIARAIDGLTGGNISVAYAAIADIADDEQKKQQYYGYMGAATALGFVMGPALSGILTIEPIGHAGPIIASVIISIVAQILLMTKLPPIHHNASNDDHPSRSSARSQVLHSPVILLLIGIAFFVQIGMSMFYTGHPLIATNNRAQSTTAIGLFYAAMSIVGFVTQGFLVGHIPKKRPLAAQIAGSGLIIAISFVVMRSSSVPIQYVGGALYGMGNGIARAAIATLTSQSSSKQYQGFVQGVSSGAGSIGSVIGLIAGGVLYQYLGVQMFLVCAGSMGAVALLGIAILMIKRNA